MAEPVQKPSPDAPEVDPSERREIDRRYIGKPFRRVDGRAKVTGVTRFADDLQFPRMCYARLVRSTVPHAMIRDIDFTRASKIEGFLGSLTGKAMPEPFGILPVSQDEHALCPDKVRLSATRWQRSPPPPRSRARSSLAVAVEYEPLTTIASVEEACDPRAQDSRLRRPTATSTRRSR